MLSLFNSSLPPQNQGVSIHQDLKYIKEYYSKVNSKIQQYRREHEWFVNNKHILKRLISQIRPMRDVEDMMLFRYIDNDTFNIGKNLELTTRYPQGKVHFNNLYRGSREAYYLTKPSIDLGKIPKEWSGYKPLKVIYTDNATLDISVPDSETPNEVTIFVEVNMFQLAFQYKYWVYYRKYRDQDYSIDKYLGSYLLPSLFGSYLDYSCWNVFKQLIYNPDYVCTFKNRIPFSISDYSKRLTQGYSYYIDKFRDTKNTYDKVLLNVPTPIHNNSYDLLHLDGKSGAKRTQWLFLVSRLGDLLALIDLLGTEGKIRNRNYIAVLKRDVRRIINYGNISPYNLPKDLESDMTYNLMTLAYTLDREKT